MVQDFLQLPPTGLDMTFPLIPGPETLAAPLTFDWVREAVLQDQVLPEVSLGVESLLTLVTRSGLPCLELTQRGRVMFLSVLDQSSLSNEILPAG